MFIAWWFLERAAALVEAPVTFVSGPLYEEGLVESLSEANRGEARDRSWVRILYQSGVDVLGKGASSQQHHTFFSHFPL